MAATNRILHSESPPPTKKSGVWRKLLARPFPWALAFMAMASPWYANGNGMDFPPFILTLIGGWCLGQALVGLAYKIDTAWKSLLLLVFMGIALSVGLTWSTSNTSDILAGAPQPVQTFFPLVQMAAIPATGWIWLNVFSRLAATARKPADKVPPRTAPVWEEGFPGVKVSFPALDMPLKRLSWIIAGVVLVVGALVVLFLVTFDWILDSGSAFLVIWIVGALFALPAYLSLKAVLGRRTVACSAAFESERLRVTVDGAASVINYQGIQKLLWQVKGDYARLEVTGDALQLCLITGFAKTDKASLPQLPPLSKRTIKRLEDAGLVDQRQRREGLTVFLRDAAQG